MIDRRLVFREKTFQDKTDVFKFISKRAKEIGFIESEKDFIKALTYREEIMTTAFDFHIAVPHGKSDTVLLPFIAYLRVETPIKWNQDSDDLVNQIFLIGIPEKGGDRTQLKYISEISKKIIDEDYRKDLEKVQTKDELYKILKDIKE